MPLSQVILISGQPWNCPVGYVFPLPAIGLLADSDGDGLSRSEPVKVGAFSTPRSSRTVARLFSMVKMHLGLHPWLRTAPLRVTHAGALRPLIWSDFVSHKDIHSILTWGSMWYSGVRTFASMLSSRERT